MEVVGGAGPLPFSLCGKTGEFVANCEAVTALVFRVPVLLLVIEAGITPWRPPPTEAKLPLLPLVIIL